MTVLTAPVHLDEANRSQAARALVRALWDDPFSAYVDQDNEDTRRHGLDWFVQTAINYVLRYGGTAHTTPGSVQGAALWLPPGETIASTTRMVRTGLLKAPFKLGLGGTMRLVNALIKVEHLHKEIVPPDHWYLWTLGVDPEFQNQGIGGRLLAPILERADRDGLPCYLESTNERNVPFYQRHGFTVVVEDRFHNGPPFGVMLREPIG